MKSLLAVALLIGVEGSEDPSMQSQEFNIKNHIIEADQSSTLPRLDEIVSKHVGHSDKTQPIGKVPGNYEIEIRSDNLNDTSNTTSLNSPSRKNNPNLRNGLKLAGKIGLKLGLISVSILR